MENIICLALETIFCVTEFNSENCKTQLAIKPDKVLERKKRKLEFVLKLDCWGQNESFCKKKKKFSQISKNKHKILLDLLELKS